MPRSRQKKVVLESTGDLPYGRAYCRKCKKLKNESAFFKAVDETIDSNGYFSVCRECIDHIYG